MEYNICIKKIKLVKHELTVILTGEIIDATISKDNPSRPKVVFYFDNGKENRRIPMVLQRIKYAEGMCLFSGKYTYRLDCIYWDTQKKKLPSRMQLNLSYGNFYEEGIPFLFGPELHPQELVEISHQDEIGVSLTNENQPLTEEVDGTAEEILDEDAQAIFDEEESNNPRVLDKKYWYVDIKSDCILFQPKAALNSAPKRIFVKYIASPLAAIFTVLNFVLALCLLPWYVLETFLSYFGIAKLDKKIKSRNPIRRLIGNVNNRIYRFTNIKISLSGLYKQLLIFTYRCFSLFPIKRNRITFISMRRTDLSGNFAFVYEQMKHRTDLDIKFILTYSQSIWMPLPTFFRFCYACAVSKVIVLDEFTPQIHYINLKKETRLIQLWHACGAFKTFGFTRLGKPKGSPQPTRMHRNYNYVTVSSTYCKRCHSEGFGISDEKVVPTGIARTDVFFDEAYKNRVVEEFYQQYPQLRDKKLILFAPTFRGDIKETAHYPMEQFNIQEVYDAIGPDYAILVKHHPFIKEQHPIPEECRDRVFDLSHNTELNDLLFVTDLIITDYSSLVFEASLLKIPMLFYVFDLQSYIMNRDFYFDLGLNSPGKLVYSQEELIQAICEEDYEPERMDAFANMFFDDFDGQSTKRIVALIEKARLE